MRVLVEERGQAQRLVRVDARRGLTGADLAMCRRRQRSGQRGRGAGVEEAATIDDPGDVAARDLRPPELAERLDESGSPNRSEERREPIASERGFLESLLPCQEQHSVAHP